METLPLFEPQDDNEQCSSSATSSIGNDSDLSETVRGVMDVRGISKFYDGKSKSFTSLVDAGSTPYIKDIAKSENAYTSRGRNLMAFNHTWEKSQSYLLRSNSGGISKKTTISSSRSTVALAFAINYESSSCCASEDSSLSSNPRSPPPLPPLHPPSTAPSSPMQHNFSSRRFFCLVDIQNCSTATTIKN
ncbi:hypothetical protein JHK85_009418 [Glycine max]|nr:hypothetical protein JHK85_009418 [Glycine max]KAG5065431.1 hypothetical protein JHK86_009162 [Glycine max]KHN29672.1 hypothetical protein glysoja_016294 [Glycine soja]